jgi:hypothetical protein
MKEEQKSLFSQRFYSFVEFWIRSQNSFSSISGTVADGGFANWKNRHCHQAKATIINQSHERH